ncbi:MAG: hypothetical protein IT384_13705 [Deltaproteobacteria bacterium]|nr:hypothetical protein [Deltaproteobacteria bacterium]
MMILGPTGFSTGELTLTFDWLSRLTRPVETHLVISRRIHHLAIDRAAHLHLLPATSGEPLVGAIRRTFEEVKPDVLVLADAWLAIVSAPELGSLYQGRSLLAPFLLEAQQRAKVLALDLYDWDRYREQIDLFGRPCGPLATALPAGIGRLLPSPYLRPTRSTEGRGHFAMMERRVPPSGRERREEKQALGLGDHVVLIASSPWQFGFKLIPAATRTAAALPELAYSLLELAAERGGPVDVVQLGPVPLPPPAHLRHLRFHHVPQLEPQRFLSLLRGADLLLSTNTIATSNIRAASLGLPVASIYLGRGQPPVPLPRGAAWQALDRYLGASAPSYPLAVGAMGMEQIVRLLLDQNPFAEIQRRFDALDPLEAVEGIAALIFERRAREELREAQARYFALLERELDSPDVALERALGGPSGR